jgi:hypothetical protein
MEIFTLNKELYLYGKQVPTFPNGIKEAFDELIALVPDGMQRSHFGLSYMEHEKVIYHAASEEKYPGEGKKLNCREYIVEKGTYLSVTIIDWMQKINAIKEVFHELMQDERVDLTKWCVEWYKSDEEMMCMVRVKE